MADWIRAVEGGVALTVRVVPRASRNEACGAAGGALRVRLQAPPVDGKANEALLAFLAGALGVPRRAAALAAGQTGRLKRVRVAGIAAAEAERRLLR